MQRIKTVTAAKKPSSPTSFVNHAKPNDLSSVGTQRRSFIKQLGLLGAVLAPTTMALTQATRALAEEGYPGAHNGSGELSKGDVAILRFLAAAELIETDLWQQYTEIALGNVPFLKALQSLDGDMPTYVFQNTRDEFSHAAFLNGFLKSKGHKPVDLSPFQRLGSSQATGSNKSAKRLTTLLDLTVDTSWYNRYRSPGNPDFGDTFPQVVDLVNVPGIPSADLPLGSDDVQFIANVAGFHFATVEQGGSSLYLSLLSKCSSLEVLNIVGSIGGTEIMHFQTWSDKAGNAPAIAGRFPQLPVAPVGADGQPAYPGDGTDPSQPNFTNQIMPEPCEFVSPHLPLCSVIRPSSNALAGARAALAGFTAMGLFNGQKNDFFQFVGDLAEDADAARREV